MTVWDAAPMDYSAQRPRGLRPPENGDTTRLVISVDLGRDRGLDDVALYLSDLATLVDVGHRWGIELSRAAVDWESAPALRDPERGYDVGRALLGEGFDVPGDRRSRIPPWEWAWGDDIQWRTLRDLRARQLLGDRTTVLAVRYENPLEVILAGSGMLIAGVILAARTIRDWSNTRRVGSATAREAEAEARLTEARADLYEHLVNETKRGQTPVPVGDLVQIVTPPEIKSLNRLAERPIALELPRGTDGDPT
jgi:hypothetical protein